jgi:hypothetical protein
MLIGWTLGMLLRDWRRRRSKSVEEVSLDVLAYPMFYTFVPTQRPDFDQLDLVFSRFDFEAKHPLTYDKQRYDSTHCPVFGITSNLLQL